MIVLLLLCLTLSEWSCAEPPRHQHHHKAPPRQHTVVVKLAGPSKIFGWVGARHAKAPYKIPRPFFPKYSYALPSYTSFYKEHGLYGNFKGVKGNSLIAVGPKYKYFKPSIGYEVPYFSKDFVPHSTHYYPVESSGFGSGSGSGHGDVVASVDGGQLHSTSSGHGSFGGVSGGGYGSFGGVSGGGVSGGGHGSFGGVSSGGSYGGGIHVEQQKIVEFMPSFGPIGGGHAHGDSGPGSAVFGLAPPQSSYGDLLPSYSEPEALVSRHPTDTTPSPPQYVDINELLGNLPQKDEKLNIIPSVELKFSSSTPPTSSSRVSVKVSTSEKTSETGPHHHHPHRGDIPVLERSDQVVRPRVKPVGYVL